MQILRARLADLHHHIILHRLRGELCMEHLHFHYRIALADRQTIIVHDHLDLIETPHQLVGNRQLSLGGREACLSHPDPTLTVKVVIDRQSVLVVAISRRHHAFRQRQLLHTHRGVCVAENVLDAKLRLVKHR